MSANEINSGSISRDKNMVVLTAEVYPIVHIDNCPNKEKADLALAELDKYQTIMYNNFATAKSDEDLVKYISEARQAKFWTENMLETVKLDRCDGCCEVMVMYLGEPLYTIRSILANSGDMKDKITAHLTSLTELSNMHSEHIEQLHKELVANYIKNNGK